MKIKSKVENNYACLLCNPDCIKAGRHVSQAPLSNFESNANGQSTWTYYIRFVVVVLGEEYLFNQSNQHSRHFFEHITMHAIIATITVLIQLLDGNDAAFVKRRKETVFCN